MVPTFAMSVFYLTKTFCGELSGMISRYWWSQQDKDNKIHWVGWPKLTRSKGRGDLVSETSMTLTLLCCPDKCGF